MIWENKEQRCGFGVVLNQKNGKDELVIMDRGLCRKVGTVEDRFLLEAYVNKTLIDEMAADQVDLMCDYMNRPEDEEEEYDRK